MIDETRRPDSEVDFEEPVFSTDEQLSDEEEREPNRDFTPDSQLMPEPGFSSGTGPSSPTGLEPVLGADEPVFPEDGESVESHETGMQHVAPEHAYDPPATEYAFDDPIATETNPVDPFLEEKGEQEFVSQAVPTTGTGWVNIAPDSEETADSQTEREYNYFEETPAADVVSQPPPTRKLGRTGPVWALGAIALVLIAGLVWLGITRLTGSPEVASETVSEPEVQQVAAETPTQQPPTAAPDPTAEPGPIQLPINTNVVVGDTEGEGVKLRASPGLAGTFIETIVEGSRLVVLEDEPGSEHEVYPVEKDGYLWYRMRVLGQADAAGNPLIGWSASDFFVVENQ